MNVFLSLLCSKLDPITFACFLRSSSQISLLDVFLNQTNRTAVVDNKLRPETEPHKKTAKFVSKWEFDNPVDKHAVKVVKGNETVGHLPCEVSRVASYFLAFCGEISVEVINRRQHCKQLCGGMEIPCQSEFTCSNKLQIKHLKELLAGKIRVYNLKMQTNGSIRRHHFYRKQ